MRGTIANYEALSESADFLNLEGVWVLVKVWKFRPHLVEDPEDKWFQPEKSIRLQGCKERELSIITHQILSRLATSKYLAEHFGPCSITAISKIRRSSSSGRYGISEDIFLETNWEGGKYDPECLSQIS